MSNVPSELLYIQSEPGEYKRPVSEASLQAMGGSINAELDFRAFQLAYNSALQNNILSIIHNIYPVGTLMYSALSETQVNSQLAALSPAAATWVLANGQSVTGSRYEALTGHSTVPDLKGYFIRGKDNGAGRNADGDTPVGTVQSDTFKYHTHDVTSVSTSINTSGSNVVGTNGANDRFSPGSKQMSDSALAVLNVSASTTVSVANTGGSETRPKNVTLNIFIKVD